MSALFLPGKKLLLIVTMLLVTGLSARADIFRVNTNAPPGGDGSSWARSFHDLREALKVARNGDEIWLKRGVHRLSEGYFYDPVISNRPVPYPLEFFTDAGLTIRGGFSGNEATAADRAPYVAGDTVLDGDVLGNDGAVPLARPSDNAKTVLRMELANNQDCHIEGLSIRAAFDDTNPMDTGSADFRGSLSSSLLLENCLIHHNAKGPQSAGVFIFRIRTTILNSVVELNEGDGIHAQFANLACENLSATGNSVDGIELSANLGALRSATLTNCVASNNGETGFRTSGINCVIADSTFENNGTVGVSLHAGSRRLTRCTMRNNTLKGAILQYTSPLTAVNDCLIEGNGSGGMSIIGCDNVAVSDTQFIRNNCGGYGANPALYINNCIFQGNHLIFTENYASSPPTICGLRSEGSEIMLANSSFSGNQIAFWNGYTSVPSQTILYNPVFVGNVHRSDAGGAIVNFSNSELTVYNGTFVGNAAEDGGDAIGTPTYLSAPSPPTTKLVHCLFWQNDASGLDPISVPLTADSMGNSIASDPALTANPDSGDGDWTTWEDYDYGDLRLRSHSPMIDRGLAINLPDDILDLDHDANVTELLPHDFASLSRIQGGAPDIGAYEAKRRPFGRGISMRSLQTFTPNAWNESYVGYWSGLIWNDSQQNEPAGSVRKMLLRPDRRHGDRIEGLTTVKVVVDGETLRFRGEFDGSGTFSESYQIRRGPLKGQTVSMELQTGLASGENYLDGTLSIDATEYKILLAQSSFHRRNNPVSDDELGRYTALIAPGSLWTVADPTGHGAVTLSVSKTGRVRLKASLADGARGSWSGKMSNSRFLYPWINLYRRANRGFLAGRIQVQDRPQISDMDGALKWIKPQDERSKTFPDGFELNATFLASKYQFIRGQRVLPGILDNHDNATLSMPVTDAEAESFEMRAVNWTRKNSIRMETSAGIDRSLKINGRTRTGAFYGRWTLPSSRERISIRGVAFQKQAVMFGNAVGNQGSTGNLEVYPAAADSAGL